MITSSPLETTTISTRDIVGIGWVTVNIYGETDILVVNL